MDPRLLRYYNHELQHLREMGAEFAEQFPKIAARLGMHGLEVADPYVERLLEGVGFLAARVQLKLDAEFPALHAGAARDRLSALPGADAVDAGRAAQARSRTIRTWRPARRCRAAARCSSVAASDDATACEFRTAQDVTLWPIEIVVGELLLVRPGSAAQHAADRAADQGRPADPAEGDRRAEVRRRSRIDRLCFYLAGRDDVANKLYELCLATGLGALVLPSGGAATMARAAAGDGHPAGRLHRRRGAAAGDAALVPGLPAAAGVLRVSAALPVLRADRALARASGASTADRARARDPVRPRRRDARERGRRVEPRAVLHAGDQPVPQARRSHPRRRQRATSTTWSPIGPGRWTSRSTT